MKNIKAVLAVAAVILAARVAGATETVPAPAPAPAGCAVARATIVAADGTIHIISRTVCVVAR
jgi:hypothetical protein